MWRSININKQNIKANTGNAILIACPHNSDYDGYCFWHSSKLVQQGRHSNAISISYNEDFVFRVKKYRGKQIVEQDELDYKDIEEIFSIMNENISAVGNDYETHKPALIEATQRTADKSLVDDE